MSDEEQIRRLQMQINDLRVRIGNIDAALLVQARCKAKRSTDKTIADNTWTVVDLDAEEFDEVSFGLDPMHDSSTNNSRIYARIDGVYLACANVAFETNSTGVRGVAICKNANGSLAFANIMTFNIWPAITTDSVGFVMIPLTLSAGDYVEMFVYQSSGGNLDILALYSPMLSLIRL